MSSFALQTKENLCGINVKKMCCKKAQLFGILFYGAKFGIDEITLFTESPELASLVERFLIECYQGSCDIEYYSSGFRIKITDKGTLASMTSKKSEAETCKNCQMHYLRGVFLSCGSVNSPDSSYRLEFSAKRNMDELASILDSLGFKYKRTVRGRENLIYFKDSETIEDFLNFIGANSAAFILMNEKIKRELRNDANRAKNCDTANIGKSIAASKQHIDAINKINAENRMGLLSSSLQETAALRLKYPDVTLSELARLHNPEITKSGLNHRLKKIVEFAEL